MEISETEFSSRLRFKDWPNLKIPSIAAGAYAIWRSSELIYCGMFGREIEEVRGSNSKKKYGLINQLVSHASGRLSGDQFCVYVANRLVIPSLRAEDLSAFADGSVTLDSLTKAYVHNHFDYQYLLVDSSKDAYVIAELCRSGQIFEQRPLLNPSY